MQTGSEKKEVYKTIASSSRELTKNKEFLPTYTRIMSIIKALLLLQKVRPDITQVKRCFDENNGLVPRFASDCDANKDDYFAQSIEK